jgi:hypothetical protein
LRTFVPTPFRSGIAVRLAPWIAAAAAGAVAAALTILIFTDMKYVAMTAAAVVVGTVFLSSGNLRLACLYSLLLLAPLRLGRPFLLVPHMGGAAAFWIDAIDVLIVTLLVFQIRDVREGRRVRFLFPMPFVFWAGMIGLGVLSMAIAPYKMMASHEVVRMVKLTLLALVVVNEVVRRKLFVHAVVALLLGVLFNSAMALTQWGLNMQFGLEYLGEGSKEGTEAVGTVTLTTREFVFRPGGLMGAGNLFAAYLALLVPVAIALLLTRVSGFLKAFLLVVVVVSQPALVVTLSRSGWIAFGVAFLAVLFFGMWHPLSRIRFNLARVSIIVALVLATLPLTPKIIQRLYQSDPNAVEVRLEWLQVAKAMIIDKPVLGVGLNNYVFVQLPYGKDKTPDAMNARYGDFWPVVHSTWAVTWAEQGTVGFVLFLAFHGGVLLIGWRNLRIRDPMMHAIGAGLLAGVIGIMADGFGSFFIRNDQHARVFWMVVGLMMAVDYWRRANEEGEQIATSPRAGASRPGDGIPERFVPPPPPRWLPSRRGPGLVASRAPGLPRNGA